MSKKIHLATVDIESTKDGLAADIAVIIQTRKGDIVAQMACLVRGIYDEPVKHCLFYNDLAGKMWTKESLLVRYENYQKMLDSGQRMLASVNSINNWLMMAKCQYNPVLTAYNLQFDVGKAENTGINLVPFNRRFCLWQAAVTAYAETKAYRKFILENHLFTNRSQYGNMSYRTNADSMAKFVLKNPDLPDEPHCSLEDILGYEKPILDKLLKTRSVKWLLSKPKPYNWRAFQVNDWYKPL